MKMGRERVILRYEEEGSLYSVGSGHLTGDQSVTGWSWSIWDSTDKWKSVLITSLQ